MIELLAIYVLDDWFSTEPMAWEEWTYVLLTVALTFLVVEVRKFVEHFAFRQAS